MKHRVPIVAGVAAVIVALVIWQCHGSRDSTSGGTAAGSARDPRVVDTTGTRARPDPKTVARGSIAGTITDEATKAPLAKARVCATGQSDELSEDLFADASCVETDAQGHYLLGNLLPARYEVSASARTYRPAVFHPGGDRREGQLVLAIGERKTAIDLALRPGGVEITGVVSDLTGGPIANARVISKERWTTRGIPMATTETDAQGKFSLWVKPGPSVVMASADGYAQSSERSNAPGKVEIFLTPASSLSGIVVDAESKQPVAGARVMVASSDWGWSDGNTVFTDEAGAFRVERLAPGRYFAAARTERGYGRTEGSVLVGLGQHVDGGTVMLWPARRITGSVRISTTKQLCDKPDVQLRDGKTERWAELRRAADGTLYADGVLPGTYTVSASCEGYQSRDKYEPIVVADKDVTGVVWDVDPGATVRGRVLTKSGEPVEGAEVWARTVGGAARDKDAWGGDDSARDGSYELTGLRAGTYQIEVTSKRGIQPRDAEKVVVAAGAVVERDLRLDDGGTIEGVVVDADGKPVAGIDVNARPTTSAWDGGDAQTMHDGTFTIAPVRGGEYRVTAERNWSEMLRKPGTTDDAKQGERAVVKPAQTTTVRIVVESQSASLRGTVVDAAGKPVPDAFVSAARESDAAGAQSSSAQDTRWWDEQPALTAVDGTFTIGKLSPGKYSVRAYRKGGGEAIAEHVATGSSARLQIKDTGSIDGTVRTDGAAPEELDITVRELATGFWRTEHFYRTSGHYVVRDLPKGHFQITARAAIGMKQTDVDLGVGEAKTGVDLQLEGMVTVTGRIVERGTNKPVAGMRTYASPAQGGGMRVSFGDDDRANISDEAGRFTLEDVPRGRVYIRGFPKDWDSSEYGMMLVPRTIDPKATGTIDLGDLAILKKRVKKDDPVGELGFHLVEQPPDTPPEQRKRQVSFIDPQGPAAKTELAVGDVINTVDGVDVSGDNFMAWSTLVRAPPGTKLALGLARGTTVTIVLAAP
ncbi:MAG TPA: carboxypeptidase regulatory-like domain-containing protein [Kofleriaceae bacterium]|nr:carboxypeptidase regulatory-like domain-containing protein [Kofleriaceae bacterium]